MTKRLYGVKVGGQHFQPVMLEDQFFADSHALVSWLISKHAECEAGTGQKLAPKVHIERGGELAYMELGLEHLWEPPPRVARADQTTEA